MKKINPLFDILIKNFQNAFLPNEQLSLDKSLLLHRGRLSFRQYIKNKKARYGIKVYELCTTDGYVINIEMYKRKTNMNATTVGQTSKIDDLVLRLMDPYLDKSHCCLWTTIIIVLIFRKVTWLTNPFLETKIISVCIEMTR
jgi:hypothetical protein